MDKLLGRKPEIALLQDLMKSTKAELLAIYGRRRIGKTFLITQFFQNEKWYFDMTGIRNGTTEQQILLFLHRIKKTFPFAKIKDQPKDWFEAFYLLENVISQCPGQEKIILFFDEFPWMDTHKSSLMPAFETLWNLELSRNPRLIVILCGSAVAWMIKKVIRNRGGLYGRLTAQIPLKPFTLAETRDYLASNGVHLDLKQITEIYMAVGGVPKYLGHIKPGQSSARAIQSLCFDPRGPLVAEFDSLYESLFDNYLTHIKIMETLAAHRMGLSYQEIHKKASLSSGGNLSQALKELVASGFAQFMPYYGNKKREGRYRLVDEYSYFYLTWIRPATKNYNETITEDYWPKQHVSHQFKIWSGYAFENICFKHAKQIIEALKLSVVAESISYWHDGNSQIDLIIDRRDQCMNLCEIKFYNKEYTLSEAAAKQLNKRRDAFEAHLKKKKALFNTLITPNGTNVNRHYLSSVDQQLDINALFQ